VYPDTTFAVDYEQDDSGLGFILGLNFTPSEAWNIGVRYETKTDIDLIYTINRDDVDVLTSDPGGILPPTGFIEKRDLPAIFGFGFAYTASPKIRIEADLTYYVNDDAGWSDPKFGGVDNGYDLGVALEYNFSPELKGSVGYLLTQTGLDPDGMLPEWPELDAHTISAGVAYDFNTALTLNAGLAKTFYGDETTSFDLTLKKDLILLGVGVQYRF
jgi:long-subunit fatty acid transport protein